MKQEKINFPSISDFTLISRSSIKIYGFLFVVLFTSSILFGQTTIDDNYVSLYGANIVNQTFESKDALKNAVIIATKQPLTFTNCIIRHAGRGIGNYKGVPSYIGDVSLVIKNCKFIGLDAKSNSPYNAYGTAIHLNQVKTVIIENNYFENSGGCIYIDRYTGGDNPSSNPIRINKNKSLNIKGGFGTSKKNVSFAQLLQVRDIKFCEIAWNEVINEPYKSCVEDVININVSSGFYDAVAKKAYPILIHDNFIKGAYKGVVPGEKLTRDNYAGGGINVADRGTKIINNVSVGAAYVSAYNNQVLASSNHGISIFGGNNNKIYNNRIVSSGYIERNDTQEFVGSWSVGLTVANQANQPTSIYYNNTATGNVVGFMAGKNRNWADDWRDPNFNTINTHLTNSTTLVTLTDENHEYMLWLDKLNSNEITVGLECSATGNITRDFWTNVNGTDVSSIPVNTVPTSTTLLTSFEGPSGVGDKYASRIRGFICAPETGSYTFWIASDNQSQLLLSTDANPENKREIAWINAFSGPVGKTIYTASRQWDKYPSQKSVSIKLIKGRSYYIEALHKEDAGGDNLAVAWKTPTSNPNPDIKIAPPFIIPGVVLSPYKTSNPTSTSLVSPSFEVTDFKFYPNPNKGNFTIWLTSTSSNDIKMIIYDLFGKQIFNKNYKNELNFNKNIQLNNIESGLYILKIIDGDKETIKKLIIE